MSEKNPSFSEVCERRTIEVVKKLESQLPLFVKSYSDFSREYLATLREIYDTGYAIENRLWGNLGMDQNAIKIVDDYIGSISKFYVSQIDMQTEFLKSFLEMRLGMMETFNKTLKSFSTIVQNSNGVKTEKKE